MKATVAEGKTLWERILRGSEVGCALAILGMAFAVSYEIAARWLFDQPTIWAQEVSVYLLIALAFLGLAATHQADEHIRIDLFTRNLVRGVRRAIEVTGLIVLSGYAWLAAYGGMEMVAQSWRFGRRSLTLLAVPVWISQLAIPIGMGLLAVAALVRVWRVLKGRPGLARDE